MLKKSQLFHSATTIGIVISAIAIPLTNVRANPSPSPIDRANSLAPQPVINSPTPTLSNPPAAVAFSPKIDTISGAAEMALVEHLAKSDVTFYGAYWCSHCQKQKSLFGATAAAKLPYIECAANAENSQRQLCKDKNVQLFPTWVVKGKFYPGVKDLKEIAAMTGYTGPTNFQYNK
jgi:thiol-disulfide isomerase/thioredoxin